MMRRHLEICVISDIHLGSKGADAIGLLNYLKSIQPRILILNGDVIDFWYLKTKKFPRVHWLVIQEILELAAQGVDVYYLTGNHDDVLRKIVPFDWGGVKVLNKLFLQIGKHRAWFFHGDIYDKSITHSKWMSMLAGKMYDNLILLNRRLNKVLLKNNLKPSYFSKNLKRRVKRAVQKVSNFETFAINQAIKMKVDFVACGHIHIPQIRFVQTEKGSTTYLNSGDWVESSTALEYANQVWSLYHHDPITNFLKLEDYGIDLATLTQDVEDIEETFLIVDPFVKTKGNE